MSPLVNVNVTTTSTTMTSATSPSSALGQFSLLKQKLTMSRLGLGVVQFKLGVDGQAPTSRATENTTSNLIDFDDKDQG